MSDSDSDDEIMAAAAMLEDGGESGGGSAGESVEGSSSHSKSGGKGGGGAGEVEEDSGEAGDHIMEKALPPEKPPSFWVGKKGSRVRFLNEGNDFMYISGTISEHKAPEADDDVDLWVFEHEDGDREELELSEVKDAIRLFKTRPKKNKREKFFLEVKSHGKEYASRFNEVVWVRYQASKPWWPALILNPIYCGVSTVVKDWQKKMKGKPKAGSPQWYIVVYYPFEDRIQYGLFKGSDNKKMQGWNADTLASYEEKGGISKKLSAKEEPAFRLAVEHAKKAVLLPQGSRKGPQAARAPIPDDIVGKRVRIFTASGDTFEYTVSALHEPAEGESHRTVNLSPDSLAINDSTTYKNFDLGNTEFKVLPPAKPKPPPKRRVAKPKPKEEKKQTPKATARSVQQEKGNSKATGKRKRVNTSASSGGDSSSSSSSSGSSSSGSSSSGSSSSGNSSSGSSYGSYSSGSSSGSDSSDFDSDSGGRRNGRRRSKPARPRQSRLKAVENTEAPGVKFNRASRKLDAWYEANYPETIQSVPAYVNLSLKQALIVEKKLNPRKRRAKAVVVKKKRKKKKKKVKKKPVKAKYRGLTKDERRAKRKAENERKLAIKAAVAAREQKLAKQQALSEEQKKREWRIAAAAYDKRMAEEKAARSRLKRPRSTSQSSRSPKQKRSRRISQSPEIAFTAASPESLEPLVRELRNALDPELMAIMTGDDVKKAKKARKAVKNTLKSLLERTDLNESNLKESGLGKALKKLATSHLDAKVKQYANAVMAEWTEMLTRQKQSVNSYHRQKPSTRSIKAKVTPIASAKADGAEAQESESKAMAEAEEEARGSAEGEAAKTSGEANLRDLAEKLTTVRGMKGPLEKSVRKKVKKWLMTASEGVTSIAIMQSSGLGKVVKKLCKHPDERVKGWCKKMLERWYEMAQASMAEADAQPEAAQPEAAQPEAAQPEAAQPEAAQPEAAQPEAAQPEAAQPKAAQPEAAQPEAAQPEAAQPEAAQA